MARDPGTVQCLVFKDQTIDPLRALFTTPRLENPQVCLCPELSHAPTPMTLLKADSGGCKPAGWPAVELKSGTLPAQRIRPHR